MLPTYPKTKSIMIPYKSDEDKIRFGGVQYGLARNIVSNHRDIIWELLIHMDGSKHLSEIITHIQKKHHLESEEVKSLITTLQKHGLIEEEITNRFSEEEVERYNRNVKLFSWLDKSERTNHWELQDKIRKSKVLIIGVGGVGANCALSLARLGVGHLTIVDFDKVEMSNLNRQSLFNKSHIGRLKVDAAAEELEKVNELVDIKTINKEVQNESDVEEIIQGFDLVILSADKPRMLINRIVNRACQKLKIPWIVASYANTVVNCSLIVPDVTPCWECLYLKHMQNPDFVAVHEAEELWEVENAVTAPVAALSANFAVQEAMLFLTGLKSSEAPLTFQLDLHTMKKQDIEREFMPDCPVCNDPNQPLEFENS